jgi:excisionase family DNA binding protein
MMEVTEENRRRLRAGGAGELRTGPPAPLGVKPREAGRLIGESRNTVYRLLAAGKLHAVKRGTSTLVLMDSIRKHMASLPAASFGADRADAHRT